MNRPTYGRNSATLVSGITPETSRASLNALLVVCHGWVTPQRLPISFPRGCYSPPRVLAQGRMRYVVLERGAPDRDGSLPRLKLVLS